MLSVTLHVHIYNLWLVLFIGQGLHTKSGTRAASSGEYFQINHFQIYRCGAKFKRKQKKDCIKSVFKTIVCVKDVSIKNIYDVQSTNIKMKKKKVQSCSDRADMFHMCLSGLHTVITTTGSKMDQHRRIQSFWHQFQTLKKSKKKN